MYQITPQWFARADTPQDLIKLSVEEIREIIKPCGLSPAKSKAIAGLSHILLEEHNGQVPESFEELEKLPGVGHKTASVVMSQAFGILHFRLIHTSTAWVPVGNSQTVKTWNRQKKT